MSSAAELAAVPDVQVGAPPNVAVPLCPTAAVTQSFAFVVAAVEALNAVVVPLFVPELSTGLVVWSPRT